MSGGLFAVTACADSGGGGENSKAFCEFAERHEVLPDRDPHLETKEVGEAQQRAPDELQDDYEVLVEFVEAIANAGPEDTEELREISARASEAGQRVAAFLEDECGIEDPD
jgi:hypothetical protein